jgi:hypothetical protein
MSQQANDATQSAISAMSDIGWDNGHYDVQHWLQRTAWRTLDGTSYGRAVEGEASHPAIHEDPLLRKVYLLDIALFIAAERTSYRAVAGMIGFAPDELSQIQLGTQVLDECRHFEVFCKRMADMGVSIEQRERMVRSYTPPALRKFYDLILEQVDRRDFAASSLAQNIILEGMAYPAYRYEIKYWSRFDPELSRTIRGAFADEAHHVGYGEKMISVLIQRAETDEQNRMRRLAREFHLLMTEAFEQIIHHYIGLYQECANQYRDLVGDVEIFKGKTLGELSEEDQTRLLLAEIQTEHRERMARVGLS